MEKGLCRLLENNDMIHKFAIKDYQFEKLIGKMFIKALIIIPCFLCFTFNAECQETLFCDNFDKGLTSWIVESESDSTMLNIDSNTLEIIAPKGLTLWFNQKLVGNIKISFDTYVVQNNGKYDRVSDLNCFWMATDPEYPDSIFARSNWRSGIFGRYYSLKTYYVGYGGNNNTTTRFRMYDGDYQAFVEKRQRPDIIKEYTDSSHLIVPNQWNHIEIVQQENIIKYLFNGEVLFSYSDPELYNMGYFAIRTVSNHLKVKNFKVYGL